MKKILSRFSSYNIYMAAICSCYKYSKYNCSYWRCVLRKLVLRSKDYAQTKKRDGHSSSPVILFDGGIGSHLIFTEDYICQIVSVSPKYMIFISETSPTFFFYFYFSIDNTRRDLEFE